MLPVDFLPGARCDFDESFDWYAEKSAQTAIRFMNAIDAALTVIADIPQRFVKLDDTYQECPVRRFPFRIIYRVVEERVVVVAVAHAKRRPGYWKQRK